MLEVENEDILASLSGDAMDFSGSQTVSHAGKGTWVSGQHGIVKRVGKEVFTEPSRGGKKKKKELFLAKPDLHLFGGLM